MSLPARAIPRFLWLHSHPLLWTRCCIYWRLHLPAATRSVLILLIAASTHLFSLLRSLLRPQSSFGAPPLSRPFPSRSHQTFTARLLSPPCWRPPLHPRKRYSFNLMRNPWCAAPSLELSSFYSILVSPYPSLKHYFRPQ